ncbi:unnamed protein product, partial [Mesorhabditis belari]|uniref:N-acetyltransferase domain-containing protein n=1 Tax=Mesorhabditis belari TaxID=2138241 RepID=A0AAF3FFP7_9BILA
MQSFKIAHRLISSGKALDASRVAFVPAKSTDLPEIVELCVSRFIQIEPHIKALGLSRQEAAPIFELIGGNSLRFPYSYKLVDQESNELVGFRLFSIGERGAKADDEEIDLSHFSQKLLAFAEVLDRLKGETFEKLPHINKMLRREITFVVPEFQRQGIANRLAHYGLDFDQLKADGVQGLVSEASSLANQSLLEKKGYRMVAQVPQSVYDRLGIKMHDGTTAMKSFFREIDAVAADVRLERKSDFF